MKMKLISLTTASPKGYQLLWRKLLCVLMLQTLKMVVLLGARRTARHVLSFRRINLAVSVDQLTMFNGVPIVK